MKNKICSFEKKFTVQVKQKNMKNTTLTILAIIIAVFSGCKKYEDGPFVSLKSAKKRIEGKYTVSQHTINGFSDINFSENETITTQCGTPTSGIKKVENILYEADFFKSGTIVIRRKYDLNAMDWSPTYTSCQPVYLHTIVEYTVSGYWNIYNHGKNISITISGITKKYTITKLKNKEMAFSGEENWGFIQK